MLHEIPLARIYKAKAGIPLIDTKTEFDKENPSFSENLSIVFVKVSSRLNFFGINHFLFEFERGLK